VTFGGAVGSAAAGRRGGAGLFDGIGESGAAGSAAAAAAGAGLDLGWHKV